MADLKTLELDIVADASSAVSNIDSLITKLGQLSTALGGLSNSSSLSTLAKGVTDLKTAMSGKGMRADSFNSIAKSINTLNGANADNIININGSLVDLQSALGGFSVDSAIGLRNVASAIQSLGNAKAGSSIQNMPALAQNLNDFALQIREIPDLTVQANNLRSVVNQVTNLGGKAGNSATKNLPHIAMDIKAFANNLSGLTNAGDNVGKLTEMAKAIAQLGYQSSTQAVTNIPKLANNLKLLFETLAKAPRMSKDLVAMTQALAQLTTGLGNVHGNTTRASKSLDLFSKSTKTARTHTFSLASAIGKLYATYFLLFRLISAVGKGIEKAMNVNEVQNYMENSMKQVARTMVKENGKAGTESAQAYLESYQDELIDYQSKITDQMSGFQYDSSNNMLMRTNTLNLGMNPNDLITYQAQFTQMADSMGACTDNAKKLSQAYTKLGADLASVKDVDYADAWADMSSGMVGMSKVMDKYGINIRVQALNQRLMDMGIDTTVNKLNAEQKALLRTIVVLDSSRYAWTDLSRTLDQPANQMRLLKNNVSALGMSIGSILLSGIARVLPYINALVIALQRLAQWIMKLFGVTLPQTTSSGVGGFGDLADSIYDTEDAMDEAGKSAKKLKNNLLGIDELNIISPDNGGSGTGGGAPYNGDELQAEFDKLFDEYMKAWDDAYKNMDNKIQSIADSIVNAFKKGDYEGIGKYISDSIKKALSNINWDSIFTIANKAGTNLADFFNGFNDPEMFYEVGKTLINGVNTAFQMVLGFVNKFDWKKAGLSLAGFANGIIQNADVVTWATAISNGIKGALKMVATFLAQTDFQELGNKIGTFLKTLDWIGILKGIAEVIVNAIGALFATFKGVFDANPLAGIIITALAGVFTYAKLVPVIEAISGVIASAQAGTLFTSAGAQAGSAVASGMAGTQAQGAFATSATTLAGHFATIFTGAIIGYQLGDFIAGQLYGEEYKLSNNRGVISGWLFGGKDEIKEIKEANNEIKQNGELLGIVKTISAEIEYPRFADATDELYQYNQAGQEALVSINSILTTFGKYNVALNDYAEIQEYVNSNVSDKIISPEVGEYILQLSANYDTLSDSTKYYLENAYGIEAVNLGMGDSVFKVKTETDLLTESISELSQGHNGMPTYVLNAENASKALEQLQGSTGTTKTITDELTESISKASQGHNGMPSYVLNMENAKKAQDELNTAIGTSTAGMPEIAKQMSAISDKSDALNTSYENMSASIDNGNQYLQEMSASVKDMSTKDLPELTNQVKNFSDNTVNYVKSASDSFTTFNTNVDTSLNTVKTSFDTIIVPIFDKAKWEGYLKVITDAVTSCTTTTIEKFTEFKDWIVENIEGYFTLDNWNLILANIPTAFETTFTNACNVVVNIVNRMIDAINSSVSDIHWDAIKVGDEEVVPSGSAKLFEIPRIQGFEMGGYPDKASLFFMNENGNAEMLGNVGGRQAVVNNDQIVQAVSQGVENAVAGVMLPYLSQIANNTERTANKDFGVKIGDREIARANMRGQRAMGRTILSTT